MLRRQVKRPLRKPLVAITPKSLLRHKEATSDLDDLTSGTFQTVLPEKEPSDPKKVTRLIMCSGKVYFDLLEKKSLKSAMTSRSSESSSCTRSRVTIWTLCLPSIPS